jgi:hypothetical protein
MVTPREGQSKIGMERAETMALVEQSLKRGWAWPLRRMRVGMALRLLAGVRVTRTDKRSFTVEDAFAVSSTTFEDPQTERAIASVVAFLWQREKETIMADLRLSKLALDVLQALHEASDGLAETDLPNQSGILLSTLRKKGLITSTRLGLCCITADGVDELLKARNLSAAPATTPPEKRSPELAPTAITPVAQAEPTAVCADCAHQRILEALMAESPLVRRTVERMVALDADLQRLRALE